ncbi:MULTISPECIES: hypothetical protein [unclassified Roseofilum]|uniref:hypothetical protein n=1 Tax=unclassified Roseofilum TaxID=2620099 RepID=UPI001B2C4133|nr:MULTISPECIES: hypothetical protein [unclassified Roseofilum]MBP0006981.1 hypothetical protein [Roseofilum sp. Belize Diploria]MBP0032887.1 hypothetical protein [Roseofilum sp. Belize BBD 4]
MPILILLIVLMAGYFGSELIALEAISLLKSLSLSPWLLITLIVSLFIWCFGD